MNQKEKCSKRCEDGDSGLVGEEPTGLSAPLGGWQVAEVAVLSGDSPMASFQIRMGHTAPGPTEQHSGASAQHQGAALI